MDVCFLYLDFLQNSLYGFAACLIGIVFSFYFNKNMYKILWGIIFGICTVVTIKYGVLVSDGMFYDFRHITMAIGGFIGSTPGFIISALIASTFRLYQGGIGAIGGSLAIISYGVFGLFLRRIKHKEKSGAFRLYFWFKIGMILAILPILFIFLYPPWGVNKIGVLRALWFPCITLTPIVTTLLFNFFFEIEKDFNELFIFKKIIANSPIDFVVFNNENKSIVHSDNMKTNETMQKYLKNPSLLMHNDESGNVFYRDKNNKEYITTNDGLHYSINLFSLVLPNKEAINIALIKNITDYINQQKTLNLLSRFELIGQMAAGMAHEVRNPITTVSGLLQLLSRKKELKKHVGHFDIMIKELNRINSLITEFLSLAKDRVVEMEKGNIKKIIEEITPLIQADAIKQDKYIETVLDEVSDILLNENELRQLILNLVRNGLEAMSSGGKITIKSFIENGEIVLAVQDEGEGIPPEILDKIGTPFFSTKDNGSGLGLATCYSIADRHNAVIEIDTNTEGTTFFVRFKAS